MQEVEEEGQIRLSGGFSPVVLSDSGPRAGHGPHKRPRIMDIYYFGSRAAAVRRRAQSLKLLSYDSRELKIFAGRRHGVSSFSV